jgi:hypothetical protein
LDFYRSKTKPKVNVVAPIVPIKSNKPIINKSSNIPKQTEISYSKVVVNAGIIAAAMPLLPFVTTWLPYIGPMTTTLGGISPLMGILFESLIKMSCIMTIYMFVNMYNGRKIKKSCKQTYNYKQIVAVIFIGLIMNILIETGRAPLIPFDF